MFASTRFASLAFAIGLACAASSAHAIDGTAASTAVVAPTYVDPGHTTSSSFIQLFNGGSADSTFTLTVVGVPSGTSYGSQVNIVMPALASVQYAVEEIVRRSGATPGTYLPGDSSYAVYIRNTNKDAGYAHVVYDPVTDLFQNHSNCQTMINEQMIPLHNKMVLTNLYTSKITGFPSTIEIHNPAQNAVSLSLDFYNSGIPSATGGIVANAGKFTCKLNRTIQANSRLALSLQAIEAMPGCAIDDDQYNTNLVISNVTGAPPNLNVGHLLTVSRYNGVSNATQMCAVNKVETTTASTAPTAYCGTATEPTPLGNATFFFVASVSSAGKIKVVSYGEFAGEAQGVFALGQLAGTSFTAISDTDVIITGTVQNGTVAGSYNGTFGKGTVSASTAACAN